MSKKDDDTNSLTYKDSGVDIDAGTELVKRIAKMAPGIDGFGGLFPLGDFYLIAGTDGVGTKLKLAFETGIHETIGIDLVAMSVNDIITSGAKPLFFLDYFATSRLDVDLAEKLDDGLELSFTDKRRFAKVRLLANPAFVRPISELGPDALLEPMTVEEFAIARVV